MRKIIIDTDCGVDDAASMLLAFASPLAEVIALTTVHGNTSAANATANCLKVLDLVGRDIPVYPGCASPLVAEPHYAAYVHGEDGLGDAGIPVSQRQPRKKHAAQALVDLANEHPGQIDLIAIGPLTNLAVAQQLDPELSSKFASLTIMGGAVYAKGNINITAEFNIYVDAEAARSVFERWPMVRILSWEMTMQHLFTKENLERFFSLGTSKSEFMRATNQIILGFVRQMFNQEFLFPSDELAVACAIDPTLITRKECHHVSVETGGIQSRGLTYVDWWDRSGKPVNAEIILDLDQQRFVQMMEDGLR
jgi:purine nucleosidase